MTGPGGASLEQFTAVVQLDIYRRLHNRFGERDWWPGETPFEVVVGAILTQNTNWTNVEKAIGKLKAAGGLEPEALLATPLTELCDCIRSSGYFNQKAARLRLVTEWWIKTEPGANRDQVSLRNELLAINGVGPETADSILLYALDLPVFVIDAYTRRIVSRLGYCEETIRYHDLQAAFHRLEPDRQLYNDFHAQFVTLAKRHCIKSAPACKECPLRPVCRTGGKWLAMPA